MSISRFPQGPRQGVAKPGNGSQAPVNGQPNDTGNPQQEPGGIEGGKSSGFDPVTIRFPPR